MAYNKSKMAQKFEKINKRQIKGRVKHSRTGAFTCKLTQKCYHGKKTN